VLENYQGVDADGVEGVHVPAVLRPFMPDQPEFLPFVKDLPKDSTSLKAKGKAETAKGGAAAPKVAKEGEVVERPKHKAEEQIS